MKSEKQTKIIQFQKDYIECYFADGTTLTWLKDILIYYSLKGNRIKLSIDSLHHSQDVSQKLAKIVQVKNRYTDDYLELPKTFNTKYTNSRLKKYKIKEYYWSQGIVKNHSEGFEMLSDDQNAKLCLSKDLYRVFVEYQQMTTYRQVSKQQLYLGAKNQKKLLLQKYSRQYVQFPTTSTSSNEIEYEYHQVKKQFTIFNLPKRWCPPLRKILDYILANDLVIHPFCHIDFHDYDNEHLAKIEVTKMPKCTTFQQLKNSKEEDLYEGVSYPLFGKPNHNYKIQWMYTQQEQMSLIGYAFEGNNLLIEKEGFWSIQNSKVTYRIKNKDTTDYEVNLMAFPLTIRFQNQSQRQIKPYIVAFHNYLQHRQHLISKQSRKPQKRIVDAEDDLISQQRWPDIGIFKAFKNEMVKVNFEDKIIVTIRDNQVKVIDQIGKSWIITSDPILNSKFGWYIDEASDFFQKIFDHQAYKQRMRLNRILEERKQLSNVFMAITKHVQK